MALSDGSDVPCEDRAVVVYRIKGNINIELRNVADVSEWPVAIDPSVIFISVRFDFRKSCTRLWR